MEECLGSGQHQLERRERNIVASAVRDLLAYYRDYITCDFTDHARHQKSSREKHTEVGVGVGVGGGWVYKGGEGGGGWRGEGGGRGDGQSRCLVGRGPSRALEGGVGWAHRE